MRTGRCARAAPAGCISRQRFAPGICRAPHAVASPQPDRYIVRGPARIASVRTEHVMRAEIEKLVDEIKQSVGLLRRHL
jgi:hypothetical protein